MVSEQKHLFDGHAALIAAIFFVVALLMRVPLRSQYAYHWDSADFTLAMHDWNVALGQPHPPGYFLYVMAGKLVSLFGVDAHSSLVWVSMVSGSALAAVMYLAGVAMFGQRAGTVAGLLALTSPLTWLHSCVALSYTLDALLVSVLVLWCWRASGSWLDAVGIGATLAVVGGVRQQSAIALVPLVIFTAWKFERRVAKLIVMGASAVTCGLLWFVPMVEMSGGLSVYLEAVRQFSASVGHKTPIGGGGVDAVLWNLFFTAAFCWNGLLAAALLLVAALVGRQFGMAREWDATERDAIRLLTIWVVPMMFVGIFLAYTDGPGHVLSFLPALFLLSGAVASKLRIRRIAVSVACAVNVGVFFAWPTAWGGALLHVGHRASEIHDHDQLLAETVQLIRARFDPKGTMLFHAREFYHYGLRHFQLYLPEFDQYQAAPDRALISPPDKPMLAVHDGRLSFVNPKDLPRDRAIVVLVPAGESIRLFATLMDVSNAVPLNGPPATVFLLPKEAGRW